MYAIRSYYGTIRADDDRPTTQRQQKTREAEPPNLDELEEVHDQNAEEDAQIDHEVEEFLVDRRRVRVRDERGHNAQDPGHNRGHRTETEQSFRIHLVELVPCVIVNMFRIPNLLCLHRSAIVLVRPGRQRRHVQPSYNFV